MSKIHELAFNAEEIDELLDSVDKKTIYQNATQSEHGLMSATDKSKLDALPTAQQFVGALNAKVDKVSGKRLSTNDYTDEDKAKVSSALQTETDPTVPSWAKQPNKPSYDYSEIGNTPDLSGFITKSVNDLTNYYLKSETYTRAEVAALIGAIQQFHYEIYATLPSSGESNVLYLIGPTGSGADRYEEYVYSNNAFTKIGDTSIDLSGYVTTSALNTALADYTTTSNLTALLSNKADKVHNATNGNFAGLDASGNLTNSGFKSSDFATASQGAKADTAYQKPQTGIPESDLSSDVQSQFNKHFKGWLTSKSQLPSNPVVGDYAYVEDNGTTYIYRCTTDGEWPPTSTEEKNPIDVTFANGKEVNEISIDDEPTAGSENLVESGGVYATIVAEDKQLKNLLHTEYVLIDGEINSTTGNEGTNGRYKHTALFPVKDKGYFFVCPIDIFNVAYYSAPFIDSEHYIELRAITEGVPEGSKYCSFIFDTNSFPSIDTLRIIPKEDIDNYLGETCVGISDTYKINTDYALFVKHLNFYKYTVKGMYLYGDSVDASQEYLVRVVSYVASTRTLRLLVSQYVSNAYTTRIDETVVVPEDKYLDTVLTEGNYNLRIIADFNQVGDFSEGRKKYFKFNSRVFYPIVNDVELKGDVESLAEDISELGNDVGELASEMNNANEIILDTSDIEVVDYTEYFDPQNGGEVGYFISAATGKKTANTDMTVTGYIPTKGLVGIRTKAASSTRGLAFYTGNDYSQYATQYISGAATTTGADGTSLIPIPPNAKYFRTTVNTSELTSTPPTAILDVQKIVTQTLQEFVDKQDKPTPRNTHVLYGYDGFCVGQKTGNIWFPAGKISSARNILTQATLDEDVKQIVSENQLMFNKMNYEVTFEVKDVDTYIGIGYYPISPYVYNELRVRNNNGSAVLEVYGGIGEPGDTYESEDFAVAESVVLPYSLTVGNVYTLGMRKFEDETYNGVDHVDGAIYYIHSYADDADADSPTEIFIPRNTNDSTGGIRNKTVAAFKGYQFVSLKLGEVEITNMFVSSPYNPHVQAMIIGASFIDGDTIVSSGGQYLKFSCKIQEKIGADSYVIGGRGGDAITSSSFQYLQKEVSLFCPKYLTPYFGTNYTDIDTYVSNFEAFTAWLVKIGVEPILVTISPVVDNPTKNAVILAENEWVRNSGFRYVDVYKAVTDGNGNWIEGYVLADGKHPTAAGHQAIYEAFVREVPELFAV